MIGIIGGTGLYSLEGITEIAMVEVATPFGAPSAPIAVGRCAAGPVAFLARHGSNHERLPGEINFCANIWALKSLGVRRIVSVSAVGSLAEEIRPGDLAIPSQYLDFTRGQRRHTFFGAGLVAHVATAEPTCPALTRRLEGIAAAAGRRLHSAQTYACVEGPRLGNRAESHLLRRCGAHLVGMTNVPEVYLAREAQLCYCTIAVVTDYDCWFDDPAQHASVEQVIARYQGSLSVVQALLAALLQPGDRASDPPCGCRRALQGAVLTSEAALPPEKRALLDFLRQ
jgi:5'-methylthioadenosine phosphorylase